MSFEFIHERVVEFAETDMAGIVHFSNFFRYMEAAEHAFFESLGLSLHQSQEGGRMSGWARVHAECDYARPLHYRDHLRVRLLVRERTNSTLSYDATFFCHPAGSAGTVPAGDATWHEIARGALTVAFVGRDSNQERMRARRMPEAVVAAIEPAPSELLHDKKDH